jgi:hypothetical protein
MRDSNLFAANFPSIVIRPDTSVILVAWCIWQISDLNNRILWESSDLSKISSVPFLRNDLFYLEEQR